MRRGRAFWRVLLLLFMSAWLSPGHAQQDRTTAFIAKVEAEAAAARAKTAKRYTLSQQKRIFWESWEAELRATRESSRKFPTRPGALVPYETAMAKIKYQDKLKAKYKAALRKRYGLSPRQLSTLEVDGMTKGWPAPRS